tara:strand:- start:8444 stop:9535 length:1092 start_codon:yes stop_codon:yes gene_type:complete
MIRILHIIGKMDRAGAETMLMSLYRNMDRNIIQFDFITFTAQEGDYDAEIIRLGGRIIPILANNPINRMLKLQKFLRQNPEYKIVHAHMLLSNAFHLLAAKGASVKHRISHSHSTSNGQSNVAKKVYEKWALIINNRLATQKIACSELAAQYLFGTSKGVWLLPNAVDIQKMITVARQSRDYINQEFNDSNIKIVQIGRLTEVKNHRFSIQVAEELKKRDVDFTMYFIGKGHLENTLKEQVRKRGLDNNIIFLGLRKDITELMASADYMIMPSLFEGFGVVLVESQATGLAAIASEHVPKEADFGLGLVEFLSIDSVNDWVDSLLKLNLSAPSEEEIEEVLKQKGFDASTNAKKLTEFYRSFL